MHRPQGWTHVKRSGPMAISTNIIFRLPAQRVTLAMSAVFCLPVQLLLASMAIKPKA